MIESLTAKVCHATSIQYYTLLYVIIHNCNLFICNLYFEGSDSLIDCLQNHVLLASMQFVVVADVNDNVITISHVIIVDVSQQLNMLTTLFKTNEDIQYQTVYY